MRSIRRSLIFYFLLLLTVALVAISVFSYQTTAQSLQDRRSESRKMIHAQFEREVARARRELDGRIQRQVRAMASLYLDSIPYDAVFAASAFASPALADGYLRLSNAAMWLPQPQIRKDEDSPRPYVPMWLAQGQGKGAKFDFTRVSERYYPKYTHLQSSDRLFAKMGDDREQHPQEYFQTNAVSTKDGRVGRVLQRSESMGSAVFPVDGNTRDKLKPHVDHLDFVELKPGVKVRRVTLLTPVAGFVGVPFFGPFGGGKGGKGGAVKGNLPTWQLYIQYAADYGPVETRIQEYLAAHNRQLADLEDTIAANLGQLRDRMLWVGLLSLLALWFGGYLVIRVGLAPLSKMSDAVSRVSPAHLQLDLDDNKLPEELQPIADRLKRALEQLQHAFQREKQAAADISHELRTPLAALMTTLEVGLKKTRSLEEYREILDECRLSGQHMYQLVERLLTLARLDAGVDQFHSSEVDVTDTAMQCADLIRPLAKARGIRINLNLPDPVTTKTDPNKLREILTNLLHNAVEYNNPNGTIDLAIERINEKVRIEVRDTGIGIKPEVLAHIFERFYRADPSRHADTPHAGLGLSIVKSYIDLMGGTIKVESGDLGTAFIIEIPFVTAQPDLATAVKPAMEMARR